MPDNRNQRPMPAVMDVGTFRHRFGTDEACWEHLRNTRWGPNLERFTCPDCGDPRGWWPANRRLVECGECPHQTSVTAGTVFHGARVPLWKWFWAIYQLAHDKKGVASLALAKQIGVCYGAAWRMLLKLRRAMRRGTERYVLQGLVEVDETYVGGEEAGRPGRPGRDSEKKVPVAVALERNDEGKPERVAMASMKRVDGHCLKRFAVNRRTTRTSSTVRTSRRCGASARARRTNARSSGRRSRWRRPTAATGSWRPSCCPTTRTTDTRLRKHGPPSRGSLACP